MEILSEESLSASRPTSRSNPTLGSLLNSIARGHAKAFSILCTQYLAPLLNHAKIQCQLLGVAPDLAEDLAHDTFLRGIEWARQHPELEVNFSWLCAITVNLARDRARFQRRTTDNRTVLVSEDGLEFAADQMDIHEAIKLLPLESREILQLVFFESNSPQEAATLLKIGQWAAYKRLERAMKKLKQLLER